MQTNILTNISQLPKLQDVIKHAKSIEAANNDISTMENDLGKDSDEYSVQALKSSTYRKNQQKPSGVAHSFGSEACTGCGRNGHSSYAARKIHCPAWGKICNNYKIKNHFSSVCRRKQDSALALVAHSYGNNMKQENEMTLSMKPLKVGGKSVNSTYIHALPDTGANICLAGDHVMKQLGLTNSNLHISEKIITTAGGFKLRSCGWIEVIITSKTQETTQKVYFSHKVKRFYLSKAACIELCFIPAGFPHCNYIVKDGDKGSKILPRQLPIKPTKIHFLPIDQNVDKLELYLKEAFSSCALNSSLPFPEMANITPAKIHLKTGAEPHIKHSPIPTN